MARISLGIRNGMLDAIETAVGTAPNLDLRTGAPPTNLTDSASGTRLAYDALPSDWLAAASSGSKAKAGTWTLTGDADGDIGHFVLVNTAGSTNHIDGTVTATGGGGDMEVNNVSITTGQTLTVDTFTITMPES